MYTQTPLFIESITFSVALCLLMAISMVVRLSPNHASLRVLSQSHCRSHQTLWIYPCSLEVEWTGSAISAGRGGPCSSWAGAGQRTSFHSSATNSLMFCTGSAGTVMLIKSYSSIKKYTIFIITPKQYYYGFTI